MIKDIRHASLLPGGPITLPDCPIPYYTLLVAHTAVAPPWQYEVSQSLVASGCALVSAWGVDCSSWDDSVDWAYLVSVNYDVPDTDRPEIMTTWHNDQTLKETVRFVLDHGNCDDVKPRSLLVLEIGGKLRPRRISRSIERLSS
jgi:hypothetical protein